VTYGGSESKTTVIRNGVDLGFFVDQPCDDAFADSLGVKGKFVSAYVGTHGMAHGLDVILDAAEILRDREDISGSHGPPWESIHSLSRQDRYAFPRRTVGTRILGVRGESREIVEKAGSGISIEPENARELAAAITALADAPDQCAAMG